MALRKKIFLFIFCVYISFWILDNVAYPRLVRDFTPAESISREKIHKDTLQLMPLFDTSCSRSEIDTHKLYPAVKIPGGLEEFGALAPGEFDFMVENLYQIFRLIEEWKSSQKGSLPEYIFSNISSGFLKIENLSFDGKNLSFKLGGLVDFLVDTDTFRIQKADGLVLMPTLDYFLEVTEDFREQLNNILEDGEANMGLDVALMHRKAYDDTLDMLRHIPSVQVRFQRHGEGESFEIKISGEEHLEPSSADSVSEAQWIGNFHSYDDYDSFFNLMNRLYYGAFGANAFGVVDKEKTLEPGCAKRSAEDFYQKIQELDSSGKLPEEIVIQDWGAGDGYSAAVFLSRMKELDQENGTHYYDRIKYILLDYSAQVVQDLSHAPYLTEHKDRIQIVQADALDSQSLERLKPALLIRANLLLNSLPIKIIEIKDGVPYEVEVRTYIDMEEGETINGYTLEQIKGFIQNGDVEILKSLGKKFFNRIKYAEQLSQIENLGSFPYGDYIQTLIDANFEGRISVDVGAKICLENMLSVLSPEGLIQIADSGYLSPEDLHYTADLIRYFGAIYHSVNFNFLTQSLGISLDVDSQFNYAGEYAPKIIPMENVLFALQDFPQFKKYFNSDTIGIPGKLSLLSQELMRKYGGLTPEGLREFSKRIGELGGTAFYPRHMFEWLERAGIINAEEYEILWAGDVLQRENITEGQLLEIYSKVYTQLKNVMLEGEEVVQNYEDALLYLYYSIINRSIVEIIENEKYLTPEYDNYFTHFLRVLGAEKAIDAMWSDLASFYPGVRIFGIRR